QDQEVPTALPTQQQPPPAPPVQQEPPPEQPAPPAPPPQQQPPAQQPPQQQPAPAPEPPQELPSPPSLRATPPATPIDLIAGGDPADLPITVTNTGGSRSEPVSATLNLPPGVSVVPAQDRFAGQRLLALDAPRRAAAPSGTVSCPAATCTSPNGLAPAETVTLRFRLSADADSSGGVITGTVSAGAQINVRIQVRVQVTPPPVAVDGVELTEVRWGGLLPGIWPYPKLTVRVANTGTSSRPVTVSVDQPGLLVGFEQQVSCTASVTPVCTTTAEVAPGEDIGLRFRLHHDRLPFHHHHDEDPDWRVTVNATLGSATDTAGLGLPPGWHHPVPDPPSPPTPTPPTPPTPPSPPSVTPPSPPSPEPPPVSRPPTHERPTPSVTPPPVPEPPVTTERSEPPEPPVPPVPPDSGGSGLGSLLDWLFGRGW
ncbi:hypothetical protein BLA60_41695, partial [Actinophytocola xinjiangensis]